VNPDRHLPALAVDERETDQSRGEEHESSGEVLRERENTEPDQADAHHRDEPVGVLGRHLVDVAVRDADRLVVDEQQSVVREPDRPAEATARLVSEGFAVGDGRRQTVPCHRRRRHAEGTYSSR